MTSKLRLTGSSNSYTPHLCVSATKKRSLLKRGCPINAQFEGHDSVKNANY